MTRLDYGQIRTSFTLCKPLLINGLTDVLIDEGSVKVYGNSNFKISTSTS